MGLNLNEILLVLKSIFFLLQKGLSKSLTLLRLKFTNNSSADSSKPINPFPLADCEASWTTPAGTDRASL